jgi:hypothetical protein
MRKINFLILFFLSTSLSAQFEEFNKIKKSVEIPKAPQIKKWTVAIYINGRNNVDMFAYKDFNRIETIGSSNDINIVAELGRAQGFADGESTPEIWSGVKRFYVIKDSDTNKINSPVVEDRKNADMGSWQEAADFLRWAKKNYPARNYIFIIWNHGWGWIDPVKESKITKSISHDFTTGNYIKTTELKKIFQKAGPVDIYISMACFMQMAEVVTEIKDYSKIIIGSEEVIQLPSFNWEDFFDFLLKNPDTDIRKLSIFFVESFKEMYQRPEYFELLVEGKYGTQLSAIDTRYMNEFLSIMKKMSDAIVFLNDKKAISMAKKDVLRFEVGEVDTDPDKLISFYADPYHFFELIDKYYTNKEENYYQFKNIFESFKNIIDKKLIIKNVYLNKDRTGKDFSNTHGISMHIPGKEGNLINYYPTYNELDFDKITNWSKAINFIKSIE